MCCADWRVTCSPHLNHRDYPENEVATQLWFDQWLRGKFEWLTTPKTELSLKTCDGIPQLSITPDPSRPFLGIEVYYTQQGKVGKEHQENRMKQFWHFAAPKKEGDKWVAKLPVYSTDKPLWAFANILYKLDQPITGVGYYYGQYTTDKYNLSSLIELVPAEKLRAANVKVTLAPSQTIETFNGDWRKEWYQYGNDGWGIRTNKLYHPAWKAPEGAKIAFQARSKEPNPLVVGFGSYASLTPLQGGSQWQEVVLSPKISKMPWRSRWSIGQRPATFGCYPLTVSVPPCVATALRKVGGEWKAMPEFRNLRWVLEE